MTEHNPFTIEELVIEAPDVSSSAKAKAGPKAARQRRGSFIQITATQASLLAGESITVSVFFHLMFRSFWAYHKPFTLSANALEYAGISRQVQLRALQSLERLELISIERGGPRKPPIVTITGTTKRK
jgi:hypothetical protein